MIGQITPLVQAAKRTWFHTALAHVAGATLTAGGLGLLLGSLGLVFGLGRWGSPLGILAGAVFLACALRDSGIARWPLPTLRRQTPKWFSCAYGPTGGGFLWGADLGLGWTTLIMFSGYCGLICWAFLMASPALGAAVLGAYGRGRGLPVLWAGLLARRAPLYRLADIHLTRLALLQQVNAAALAFVACYNFVSAIQ